MLMVRAGLRTCNVLADLPPGTYAKIAHILYKNPQATGYEEMTAPESFGPKKIVWLYKNVWFFYSNACVAEEGHDVNAEGFFDRKWGSCTARLSKWSPRCFKGLENKSAIAMAFFTLTLVLIIASGYGAFASLKPASTT